MIQRGETGAGARVAIACGGTGGHLYPGLAVAEVLLEAGRQVVLFVSRKEVDQQAVRTRTEFEVVTLPAVGLAGGNWAGFARGLFESVRLSRRVVQELGVGGVLGMGGFMSAGPLVAGRWAGRATVLHEANAVPGRANRWLSHGVHEACVNFADTALALSQAAVEVVGMPVRARFEPMEAAACRLALGLDGRRPVLLVAGGSQGARGLNAAVRRCAPALLAAEPELQLLHLTGAEDFETTRRAYAAAGGRAVVRPFLTEMELALGAATLAVSRAGASTLAELAAMRVPALLIPFPAAVDDHQYYNARAFVRDGAARVLRQDEATPERLTSLIRELLGDEGARQAIRVALGRWHRPDAAMRLARAVLRRMPGEEGAPAVGRRAEPVGTAGAGRRV